MTTTQSLGDRMREYMDISNIRLIKRTPVIIFVDGRAFHTFTRGMNKPFDDELIIDMWETAKFMCQNIEGAKLAYVQSDEISILLNNYETLNQGAWFDYRVQKIASVAASLATVGFNAGVFTEDVTFDARCFNLDREEVANWFASRQIDWTRNSIQMLAQSKFSQKKLNGKNKDELQEMLFNEFNINWNDLPIHLKRGACIVKNTDGKWIVDGKIPIFTQDREYIEQYVYPERN